MVRMRVTDIVDFSRYNKILEEEINKELDSIARYLVQYSRMNHRYENKSGSLNKATKADIDRAKQELVLYIDESLAPHGKYITRGFGTWAPDRFLKDALEANKDRILKDLEKATKRANRRWNK